MKIINLPKPTFWNALKDKEWIGDLIPKNVGCGRYKYVSPYAFSKMVYGVADRIPMQALCEAKLIVVLEELTLSFHSDKRARLNYPTDNANPPGLAIPDGITPTHPGVITRSTDVSFAMIFSNLGRGEFSCVGRIIMPHTTDGLSEEDADRIGLSMPWPVNGPTTPSPEHDRALLEHSGLHQDDAYGWIMYTQNNTSFAVSSALALGNLWFEEGVSKVAITQVRT